MSFYQLGIDVNEAEAKIRSIENNAWTLGSLVRKPIILRNFSVRDLVSIKKQLKNFNMHTGQWKKEVE